MEHVTVAGAGHVTNAREPVLVNQLIHEFDAPAPRRRVWVRPEVQPRRALLVSSPIAGVTRKLPYLLAPPVPLTWVWLKPRISPALS